MKKLTLIFFAFVLWACATKPKQKELFTAEELKLINENKDILNTKGYSFAKNDTDNYILLLYALKAVKLDTTVYKNTVFRLNDIIFEYINDVPLYDSLCEKYYGTKIMRISTREYFEKMGAKSIDSLLIPNKKSKSFSAGYWLIFDNLVHLIEKKHHYTGMDRSKAHWKEREISFYRHYNNNTNAEVKEAGDFLKGKTKTFALNDVEDGNSWLTEYCQSKQPGKTWFLYCNDSLKNMIEAKNPYKLTNEEYKNRLLWTPIVTYDSMGVLQSVSCKNKKYEKPLFDLFSKLNGLQEIKLLNKKRIGFSFYAITDKQN
ncbi:MAG TPA: hypothetical protein VK835_09965 [Bacteroidia bacterium]|jgi:hypothetical protein|nr:hypothetical protein [Bacteroidia bacterium]